MLMKKEMGRLERICRYPVKSMAGEEVESIHVHETGLNGDRVFAFYDYYSRRESLPYFTGREKGEMLLLKPGIVDEPDNTQQYPEGYKPRVDVTLPDRNGTYDISSLEVINYIRMLCHPKDVSITLDHRIAGIQDSKPISIIGLQTVNRLSQESGVVGLDPRRFRENFYVSWGNDEPFFEDSLVGRSLQVGDELLLHIVKRNERCPMICIDPDTADYDKRVLGTIAKQHEIKAGVYAIVRQPGLVSRGDPITLE